MRRMTEWTNKATAQIAEWLDDQPRLRDDTVADARARYANREDRILWIELSIGSAIATNPSMPDSALEQVDSYAIAENCLDDCGIHDTLKDDRPR